MVKKNSISRKDKFQLVATRRIQNAVDHLNALTKCANRDQFDYSKSDVDKMMNELKSKISTLENHFNHGLENGSKKFKF
jgi:hypothetical protein